MNKTLAKIRLLNGAKTTIYAKSIIAAWRAMDGCSQSQNWLSPDLLPALNSLYPYPPDYGYDQGSLEKRGKERADFLLQLVPGARSFLEVGCYDGMVSAYLQKAGKQASGIDITDSGFCKTAIDNGVTLISMDASAMSFADNSFDCVFSYDAMEHFPNHEHSIAEMARVLKPGGKLFMWFGPLYNAPKGLHAYRSVSVPYCQHLFTKEDLQEFCHLINKPQIDYNQLNGLSYQQHLHILKSCGLNKNFLLTEIDHSALNLVIKYPYCFKNKQLRLTELTHKTIICLYNKLK